MPTSLGIQKLNDRRDMKLIISLLKKILHMLEGRDKRGEQKVSEVENQLQDLNEAMEKTSSELASARKSLTESEARSQLLRDELSRKNSRLESLEADFAQARGKLEAKTGECAALEKQLAALTQAALPEQERLLELRKMLAALKQPFRDKVAAHYNLDSVPLFLTQLGQFAKLRECWKSCGALVFSGESAGNIGEFLLACLEIYNAAIPEQKAEAIFAPVGAAFDFKLEERLGPRGDRVAEMLLPGLTRPNGEISSKCLVRLA